MEKNFFQRYKLMLMIYKTFPKNGYDFTEYFNTQFRPFTETVI